MQFEGLGVDLHAIHAAIRQVENNDIEKKPVEIFADALKRDIVSIQRIYEQKQNEGHFSLFVKTSTAITANDIAAVAERVFPTAHGRAIPANQQHTLWFIIVIQDYDSVDNDVKKLLTAN